MNYENGIDLNFDGHCDLCGKFVDSYGHHKACAVFDKYIEKFDISHFEIDFNFNKLDNYEITNRYFISNPYRNRNGYYGSRYWSDVENYTSPEIYDPYSGISINKFLRDSITPENKTIREMYEKVIHIDTAIDDFVLKSRLVTYRGFSIDKDSSLCKTFDEAYEDLNNGDTLYFQDKGFVSTTTSINYARHRSELGNGNAKIKMAIILEPGQKCMPLVKKFHTTYDDKEREFLLQSNQFYEIISVERYQISSTYYYNVVVILRGGIN